MKPVLGTPLTTRLVPVVDKIRQLYTMFGINSYRVFLVHVQWSGGRIGEGQGIEIAKREILPTPRVSAMSSTTEILHAVGVQEEGGITISQISAKYTEDDLMGRTPDMVEPALPRTNGRGTEFFYEIVENRPSTPQPVRRMYVPNAAPALSRDSFQWTVSLTKRDYDRSRSGTFERRSY